MRASLILLVALFGAAQAVDLYWNGATVDLSQNARWMGGVNPATGPASMTTFGTSGQTSVGSFASGTMLSTGNTISFVGNVALKFATTGTSGISLVANSNAQPAVMRPMTGPNVGNYSGGFNWNNPINWITAPNTNVHPLVPPGPSDRAIFLPSSMSYFASTYGVQAAADAVTNAVNSPTVDIKTCAGSALGTAGGQTIGSTLVVANPCNLFNGVTAQPDFGANSYTFLTNNVQYRVVTTWDGNADVSNNGNPWVYQVGTDSMTGPMANISIPCRFGYGACGGTSASSGSGASSSSTTIIAIVVIIVVTAVIVVVGVVVYKKKGSAGGESGGRPDKAIGFDNPLYDHNQEAADESTVTGEYMDLPAVGDEGGGYMDVPVDQNPSGDFDEGEGYYDNTNDQGTGGYMDVHGDQEDDY